MLVVQLPLKSTVSRANYVNLPLPTLPPTQHHTPPQQWALGVWMISVNSHWERIVVYCHSVFSDWFFFFMWNIFVLRYEVEDRVAYKLIIIWQILKKRPEWKLVIALCLKYIIYHFRKNKWYNLKLIVRYTCCPRKTLTDITNNVVIYLISI